MMWIIGFSIELNVADLVYLHEILRGIVGSGPRR